jgi:hypothetical protein
MATACLLCHALQLYHIAPGKPAFISDLVDEQVFTSALDKKKFTVRPHTTALLACLHSQLHTCATRVSVHCFGVQCCFLVLHVTV